MYSKTSQWPKNYLKIFKIMNSKGLFWGINKNVSEQNFDFLKIIKTIIKKKKIQSYIFVLNL